LSPSKMALEDFRNKFGTAFAEFVGTFTLVLTIQLSVASGSASAPSAIGLVLVAVVYACGPISGAHVNPAVTWAIFLRGKIAAHDVLMYWVAQLAGGVVGALVGAIIAGSAIAPALGKDAHLLQAFLAELVFVAILCFVVLAVATSSAAENNSCASLSDREGEQCTGCFDALS
jgi:aquaporin Z